MLATRSKSGVLHKAHTDSRHLNISPAVSSSFIVTLSAIFINLSTTSFVSLATRSQYISSRQSRLISVLLEHLPKFWYHLL